MPLIFEEPAVRERLTTFTVEKYHLLFEMGALAPNVELIRGALVEKMPKSPLHASIVTLLQDYLPAKLPPGWARRAEQPLTFAALDSEPEPDLAVVRGSAGDFFRSHPTSAALIIEVVVTSEALDRIKLELYAEAGVPEAWLILAEERVVERHTEPQGARYQRVERVAYPATLESTIFPGLALPPAGLFGA
jgi:Uma2 family endonuclease